MCPEPKLWENKKQRKIKSVFELKSFSWPFKTNEGEVWHENNNWKQKWNFLL